MLDKKQAAVSASAGSIVFRYYVAKLTVARKTDRSATTEKKQTTTPDKESSPTKPSDTTSKDTISKQATDMTGIRVWPTRI